MVWKYLSLAGAFTALCGAVIYAQNKADNSPKKIEIFETSKSGAPTPLPNGKDSPKAPKKIPASPEQEQEQGQSAKPGTNIPRDSQNNETTKPKPQKSKTQKQKKKKVMPSSKSYIPD